MILFLFLLFYIFFLFLLITINDAVFEIVIFFRYLCDVTSCLTLIFIALNNYFSTKIFPLSVNELNVHVNLYDFNLFWLYLITSSYFL